ncbi:hypothetical protein AB4144_19925, partial [Rhizobiaceae sp. 2RAB30]
MAQERHLTPNEQLAHAAAHPGELSAAIAEADIVPLLMSYVQLTGDHALLQEAAPHIKGAWNYMQFIPTSLQHRIRTRLVAAVMERAAASTAEIAYEPPADAFKTMIDVAVGETVPPEYVAVFREEMMMGGKDG